jgi:Fe-S-cluster containining protein
MTVKGARQDDFFDVCINCKDGCCWGARPPLTVERKRIIESYLREHRIPIENPFTRTEYDFPREDAAGYCVFYDRQTRHCRVHAVKPETCAAGPVTFNLNRASGKIEWFLKMEQICQLAGKLYRNKPRLEKHLEAAKKEITSLVSELDPGALQAILKIDEPETFKIGEDNIAENVLNKLAGR